MTKQSNTTTQAAGSKQTAATLHSVYLGLGTNLGNREENILRAYGYIEQKVGSIVRRSSPFHSEPWGFESDNAFVNTAVCVETGLSPQEVLSATQEIERQMGRTQKSVGGVYHDRIIDIDILLYDDLHLQTPELTLPHPHIGERPFVYEPLNEILLTTHYTLL